MSTITKTRRPARVWTGVVFSKKMDKTLVVKVEKIWAHPVYKKRFKRSRKYKVHNPDNLHQVGDEVNFIETRPISKQKKWIILPRPEVKVR